MIDLSTPFRLHPAVRYRIIDGEAVVVQQHEARVMSLNETATVMLGMMDGHRTLADILTSMQKQYAVAPEILESDALRCIEQLLAEKVIDSVNPDH